MQRGAQIFLLFICVYLILLEGGQLKKYFINSPVERGQCIANSFGCKEAVKYLSEKGMCQLVVDERMTPIDAYFDYYYPKRQFLRCKSVYYVLWAPETHSKWLWAGIFRHRYDRFHKQFPSAQPVKIFYYPDNSPAIKLYKIEDKT